ncbi:unnamed protein product [Danaus chrysippus]|uniref:Protein CASC3 n=1 Tax=Danaus chrysippus TaxID=151541 RepID=A0A8J2VWV8_9NEOP|nr:unnamed protein product [Danaus chrysippus]
MTSVARRREQDDSGEYSDASQDIEQNNSGIDGAQHESDYDSQGSESEHSDGDPEKQETERRVDDDEDRSNPQYIPKRGTFYEHDDRTAASGEETTNTTSETVSEKKEGVEPPAERRRPPRKADADNKWAHDKYNENEQIPKSRDELVAIYGYDIRNEDAPPHARRNRRYGRGPNKYTRTWEDEEAYRRQLAHKKPPSPADFPELGATNKPGRKPRARPRSKSQPASNESSENGAQLRRNASIKTPKQKPVKTNKTNQKQAVKENIVKMENLTITTPVNNSTQRRVSAQQRPVPTETKHSQPPSQNNAPKPQAQQKPQQTQAPTSGSEPRIKRYSSLRQRPLAESYSPQQQQPQQQQQQQQPQQQQQQRYHPDFVAGQQPPHQANAGQQMHPQQIIHPQVHRNQGNQHGPSPPHQQPQHPAGQHPPAQHPAGQHPPAQHPPTQHPAGQHPPTQHPPGQQHTQQRRGMHEPHVHHSMHNMPQQHNIGQLQPAQGYAPPAMMPAQYMQGGSSGGVFGAPMYPAPAYQHQMYPHHNFTGGVTYYSCAEQEQAPRAVRRPTAAIPIVRPDRPSNDRPANSTEKDNIDRIVENMFVRKPWPAQEGKEKQERNSQEPQSKETSQPNSLTSSSISTDSKTEKNEEKQEKTETQESVERTESGNTETSDA